MLKNVFVVLDIGCVSASDKCLSYVCNKTILNIGGSYDYTVQHLCGRTKLNRHFYQGSTFESLSKMMLTHNAIPPDA